MIAPQLLVVGLGNSLAGDDGVGLAAIDRLRAMEPLPGVRLVEGGTDASRWPALWQGEPRVWFADAVMGGAAPGTLYRVDHERLLAIAQRHVGAHGLSLPECLRWLATAEPALARVRYRLWGVEPAVLGPCVGLSRPVRDAVATIVAEIVAEALPLVAPAVPAARGRRA